MSHEVYKFGVSMGYVKSDETSSPVLVQTERENFVDVAASNTSSFLLTKEGKVYSWGFNLGGQLGLLDRSIISVLNPDHLRCLIPVKIVQVACGRLHSLVLTDDGQILSFGNNEFGQVGIKKTDDITPIPPTRIEKIGKKVIKIASGLDHVLALTDNQTLYGWGYNEEGQLGLKDFEVRYIPTKIPLSGIQNISCGLDYSIAVHKDGYFYSFGAGQMLQLGHGDKDDKDEPTKIQIENEKVDKVICGGLCAYALTKSGSIYVWGSGSCGRLGTGDEVDIYSPKKYDFFDNNKIKIIKISAGGGHNLALSDKGEVYSWGLGAGGRLGHGDDTSQYIPKKIEFFTGKKVVNICASIDHSIVITE